MARKRFERPDAEQEAECSTHGAQEAGLGEKLAHDAPSRRPERRTQRDFRTPLGALREQDVAHVGRGDDQGERRADEDHDIDGAKWTDEQVADARRAGRGSAMRLWKLGRHAHAHRLKLGVGRFFGCSRPQTAEGDERRVTSRSTHLAVDDEWNPDFCRGRKPGFGRHDPDDGARYPSHRKPLADRGGTGGEMSLPISVPQNHDVVMARRIFRRFEVAPQLGP